MQLIGINSIESIAISFARFSGFFSGISCHVQSFPVTLSQKMGCKNTKEKGKWQKVYTYLKYEIQPWYSMNIDTFCKLTTLSRTELNNITYPNGKYVLQFQRQFNNDWVNVFTFKKIVYVGLESRKKDYETDKQNNDNYVEMNIKRGYYD